MNSFVARRVADADWKVIQIIEQSRYGDHGYDKYFLRVIPILFGSTCLICYDEAGTPLGYALAGVQHDCKDVAWLLSIVSVSDGSGVGRFLLDEIIALLKVAGRTVLKLTVSPGNARAVKMYRNSGFQIESAISEYYGPGEDRYVMTRPL